jgi:tetratricopeptide (TPR) repeat protein
MIKKRVAIFRNYISSLLAFFILLAHVSTAGNLNTLQDNPPQEDTLLKWMDQAPQDTNTLNLVLMRSQFMFRTRPPAEIMPYIEKATQMCNRLIHGASPKMQYIIKKKLSRVIIFKSMVYGYGTSRDSEKERAFLMEALKLLQEINVPLGIANVYNNIAASYAGQEKYVESLAYHLKALKIREQLHDSSGLAQTYGGLTEIYFRTKKYKEALKYGNQALEIAKRKKNFAGVAERLRDLGSIYLETAEYDLAKKNLRSALRLADSLDYATLKGNLLTTWEFSMKR